MKPMKPMVAIAALLVCAAARGEVIWRTDRNGDPVAEIRNAHGECTVALRGAQVTACRFAGDEHPLLFVPAAGFDSAPVGDEFVHGGVPLLWPWFGSSGAPEPERPSWWGRLLIGWGWRERPAAAPFHATARQALFTDGGVREGAAGTTLVLKLGPTELSRRWFPHEFELEYGITLGPRALALRLVTHNRNADGRAFAYGVGYHPYLLTSDCYCTWMEGLDGAAYESTRDLPCDREGKGVWSGRLPVWPGCDLFKLPGANRVTLVDPGWRRRITLATDGGGDVVTWIQNKELTHVKNVALREIRDFVCIEPANFYPDRWPTVAAGGSHAFQTTIRVEPLP